MLGTGANVRGRANIDRTGALGPQGYLVAHIPDLAEREEFGVNAGTWKQWLGC